VATMGGRIWARALPEGGSEFGFSLPVYADEPEPWVDSPAARLAGVVESATPAEQPIQRTAATA
jgi:hypothetical protein